jgi:hypothetical protein
MLSTQQLKNCDYFLQELQLKQLASSEQVSIVYIHGTARSGSTIAEIILAQLADLAIHQPFRGTLQKYGGRFRTTKLDFDADIYDSACGLIVKQINQCLQTKNKITVVIKELAGFFQPKIWQRWVEIPDKFLFTIREPHLQYMSWLSAMTDQLFQGSGELQEDRNFVISQAKVTESSWLSAEWSGTTISCNQVAWKALSEDFKQVKKVVDDRNQKIAILDSVLLRYNPEVVLKNAITLLGFTSEKLSQLNLTGLAKTEAKVWDIRDKSRPMVRKANSSNTINPLSKEEAVHLDVFPLKSQQHIQDLIPLYLDLLYASEQVYLPSLEELKTTTETGLMVTHPVLAYAIALFHLQAQKQADEWFKDLNHSRSIDKFQSSLNLINNYWDQAPKIHG